MKVIKLKFIKNSKKKIFKKAQKLKKKNNYFFLGKYDYLLKEWDDPEYTFFEIKVPKFLDTSLLDINLNPKWVSIRIKGKLTQMRLQDEIIVEKSTIQRSQITGFLTIKMLKLNPNYLLKRTLEKEKEEKKKETENKKIGKENIEINKPKEVTKTHDETTFDEVPDLE